MGIPLEYPHSWQDTAACTEPLRSVRDHLSDFVDRAEREHERVVVTRNGRPGAVLIGYEDLAALEETLGSGSQVAGKLAGGGEQCCRTRIGPG